MKEKKYTLKDMNEIDIALAPGIDLPPFEVKKFYLPKDGERFMVLEIDVPRTWRPEKCPYCGSNNILLDGHSKRRVVRDIARNNHSVILIMEPRRYKCGCKECSQRIPIEMEGFKKGASVTDRVIEFIQTEAFFQNFQVIAERTGLTSTTVAAYFDEKVEELEKERKANPPEAPHVLGIDEKHNENKTMGVLVDITNSRLLEITEANDEASMEKAIKGLKNWDKNIKVVTTDMAGNYHSWLPKILPNATLVVDKFHVMQGINRATSTAQSELYSFVKAKIKRISDLSERETKMTVLKYLSSDKRLLNYNSDSINKKKKEQLDAICSTFPEFELLKQMSLKLENMYKMTNRTDAEKCWDEWQAILPPSKDGKGAEKRYETWCKDNNVPQNAFSYFRKFTSKQGYPKYKDAILNYFLPGCRVTNAATEGFNNLIGIINSRGSGYGFRRLRALALYAPLAHSRVKYSFNLETKTRWVSSTDNTKFMKYSQLNELLGVICKVDIQVYNFTKETTNISVLTQNIISADAQKTLYSKDETIPKVPKVKPVINPELSIQVKA